MVVARVRALNTACLQNRLVVARVRAPRSARQRELRRSIKTVVAAGFISVDESKHRGKCLAEEREAKDSAREAPNATGRCCETTSRALRSLPFAVWHDVEV